MRFAMSTGELTGHSERLALARECDEALLVPPKGPTPSQTGHFLCAPSSSLGTCNAMLTSGHLWGLG